MVLRTCADLSPSSDLTSMVSTGMGKVWDASSDQLVHRKQVRPLWHPDAIGDYLIASIGELEPEPTVLRALSYRP